MKAVVSSENVARQWTETQRVAPPHLLVRFLVDWPQHEHYEVIQYLREENPVPKARLRNQRVWFVQPA